MLLEFYTKYPKMQILTCLLAAYGVYNIIMNSFVSVLSLTRCFDSVNPIDLACHFWRFFI